MRKELFIAFAITATAHSVHSILLPNVSAQQQIPSYAKWSQIAIKETALKYPNANVIDYLHIGKVVHDGMTIEKFKLWLKEGNREFGMIVNVKYLTETEQLVDIEFQETTR
ncbi:MULTISPECIES: DUF3889 domain-containing protein [Sporosarcina]|uniref:DUF3889 domain-containing protein n=1 Tax=Sporosarcina contaminans TaxID=633403 RepID=A0ABW3TU67_9BACL